MCSSDLSDAPAGERTCSVKDCFYARDVRDFKVVDRSTVIVYVGAQKCAFRVQLRGTFCDLTYAPELVFSDPKEVPLGEQDYDPNLPSARRGRASLKVCDNNLGLQVSGGAFSNFSPVNALDPLSDPATRVDRFGRDRKSTRLNSSH